MPMGQLDFRVDLQKFAPGSCTRLLHQFCCVKPGELYLASTFFFQKLTSGGVAESLDTASLAERGSESL